MEPEHLSERHTDAADEEIGELAASLDEAPSRRPPQRVAGRRPVFGPAAATVLALVAVCVTAANIAGWGPFARAVPDPTPAEVNRQLRLDLLATIGYVEAFRERHGRIPSSFAEAVDEAPAGIDLDPVGSDSYVLTAGRRGVTVRYDSRLGLDEFLAREGHP